MKFYDGKTRVNLCIEDETGVDWTADIFSGMNLTFVTLRGEVVAAVQDAPELVLKVVQEVAKDPSFNHISVSLDLGGEQL